MSPPADVLHRLPTPEVHPAVVTQSDLLSSLISGLSQGRGPGKAGRRGAVPPPHPFPCYEGSRGFERGAAVGREGRHSADGNRTSARGLQGPFRRERVAAPTGAPVLRRWPHMWGGRSEWGEPYAGTQCPVPSL